MYKNILAKNINTNEVYENQRIDALLFKIIKKQKLYYNILSKEFDLLEIDETDIDYVNKKLAELKQIKKQEASNYYNSDGCFTFTLKDKDNNSITQKHSWFLEKLSTKPFFFSDSEQLIQKDISIENVFNIKNIINNLGIQLNIQLNEAHIKVDAFEDLQELKSYDATMDLKNVDRVININELPL